MGTLQRIHAAWRTKKPARPGRYLAVLLPVGLAHGVSIALSARVWGIPASLGDLAIWFAVPAAWIVGWAWRGRIVTARGWSVAVLAFWLTLAGLWIACSFMAAAGAIQFLLEGDWRGLVFLIFSWLVGGFLAVVGGAAFLPAGVLATVASMLVLRMASGGALEREAFADQAAGT